MKRSNTSSPPREGKKRAAERKEANEGSPAAADFGSGGQQDDLANSLAGLFGKEPALFLNVSKFLQKSNSWR